MASERSDLRVLVTGASRGIGRAIALALAREGYALTLHGRAPSAALDETLLEVRALGATAHAITFDIGDRAASLAALDAEVATHGAPYGVVLNAGVARDGTFAGLSDEDWDAVLSTNLDGFYNVLKPLTMPMVRRRKPGRIVTLASVSGLIGNRGQVNYSAAKAGIIGATKALAIELASRAITVNCVAPGLIATEMIAAAPVDEALKLIPAGRIGEAQEVASLVAYLLSPGAAYITRQVISVNGGMA